MAGDLTRLICFCQEWRKGAAPQRQETSEAKMLAGGKRKETAAKLHLLDLELHYSLPRPVTDDDLSHIWFRFCLSANKAAGSGPYLDIWGLRWNWAGVGNRV